MKGSSDIFFINVRLKGIKEEIRMIEDALLRLENKMVTNDK